MSTPVKRPGSGLANLARDDAPNRAAGVPTLGPTAPRPAPAPAAVQAAPAGVPAQRAERPAPAPTARKPRKAKRGRRYAPDLDGVVVYVPAPLRDRLRREKARTPKLTYTDMILDALDHLDDEELERLCPPTSNRSGGRFVGRTQRRERTDEALVQVTLHPDPADLATIDELAARYAGDNRSRLVRAALDRHLPA